MQCCGTAFSVGGLVAWTLAPAPEGEFPASVLGSDDAASLTHREEHHGGLPDDAPVTTGTVRSIQAAFCRYGPVAGSSTLYPISGSLVLREKQYADGWEPEGEEHRFVCYLVDLDELEG
jgi:hypothetical protein